MKYLSRFVVLLLITVLVIQIDTPSYAQDLDSSSSTSSAASTSISSTETQYTPSYGDTSLISPTPIFNAPLEGTSAQTKTPTIIRSLKKKSFRSNEDITVEVDNAQSSRVEAAVYDISGNEADFDVFTVDNGISKMVTVKSPREFKPGKYKITISSGGQTYTQDFTWGVLAVNTNKSIYLPDEKANLAMAVLDENGDMVCDAKVTLLITGPDSKTTTLSTDTGEIKVNPVCQKHDVTIIPDYQAEYMVGTSGNYNMELSAVTRNGTYTISDAFKVQDSVEFDVERVSATRIYPPNSYPVEFNITAQKDFTGNIIEAVPANFAVNQDPSSKYQYKQVQKVSQTSVDTVLGASTSANLSLPFTGNYPISEEFGERLKDGDERNLYAKFNLAGHDGVDFDMPVGTEILAVDDGKVVLAGPGAYGNTIAIEHSWGRSYYGHLSAINVSLFDSVKKGDKIALSGNTGYTTGPHLHFGVKPNNPDMRNGYYGKIDPFPLLGIESSLSSSSQVKLITWDVSLKKGESITLGYFYRAPNISPQFYRLGPLRFYEEGKNLFFEKRQWQIAVDQDGGGTNTVSPSTGSTSATNQAYAFTYTTAESSATGSGAITIQVPSGWTAPQTSNSSNPGYTSVSASSTGTAGDVLDVMDSNTSWVNVGANACGGAAPTVASGTQPQGTGNLQCVMGNVSAGNGIAKNITSADWTNYTIAGAWIKTTVQITTSDLAFAYDNNASLASPIERIGTSSPATIPANMWTWVTWTFGATTRTAVVSFGFLADSATGMDTRTFSVDYVLIGPGTPTVTGSGPWTITTPIVTIPATTGTIIVNYGALGAGAVTNSSSAGIHTFTTQSKIATNPTNLLTNISAQPTVTLSSGPTVNQLMRHGEWFLNGVDQPFAF